VTMMYDDSDTDVPVCIVYRPVFVYMDRGMNVV
jgi:hypothetical protein